MPPPVNPERHFGIVRLDNEGLKPRLKLCTVSGRTDKISDFITKDKLKVEAVHNMLATAYSEYTYYIISDGDTA